MLLLSFLYLRSTESAEGLDIPQRNRYPMYMRMHRKPHTINVKA